MFSIKFNLLKNVFLQIFTLFFVLAITTYSYQKGYTGGFYFDDIPNLSPLGAYDEINSLEKVKQFLDTGISGPTGRPISLLSFLLNDNTWPSNAYSFKQTNLSFHLITGLLFALLSFYILTGRQWTQKKASWCALLAMSLWLLHPLMVSTVLFTVQRMTILSTAFTLASLACYSKGRLLLRNSSNLNLSAYGLILLAMPLFAVLGVLSKENAALIPLYCLLLEFTIFQVIPLKNQNKYWPIVKATTVYLPSLIVIGYLLYQFALTPSGHYPSRNFGVTERLLTESRVLIDYLHIILIPQPYSAGLYSDGYPISTDLLSPISTLISIIILLMLFVLAFRLRKKQPFVTLSIGFYFIGHLIESTFIGLEIYFEHRNYLPSVFIFLLISSLLFNHYQKHKKTVILSTTLLFIVYLSFLNLRTSLWGTEEVKLSWAQKAPLSVRAHLDAASYWEEKRNAQRSLDELMKANQADPQSVLPYLSILLFECKTSSPNLLPISTNTLNSLLTNVTYHMSLFNGLQLVVHTKYATQCDFIDKDDLLNLLKATLANPSIPYNGHKANIYHLIGEVYLNEKDIDNSLLNFKKAMNTEPNMNIAFVEISQLAEADYLNEALDYIDFVKSFELFKQSKSDKLFSEYTLDSEIERLKSTIENAKTEKNSVKNGK